MKFRRLKAEEIDVRVGGTSYDAKGAWLLLYKDARCDMNILDETLGVYGWQRHHEIIGGNLYCTISLWDDEKKQWIEKQDVGTESNQDKEKGQASDSFKRAAFNIGIGRELYTAPFIWISDKTIRDKKEWSKKKFKVSRINYNDLGQISELNIVEVKNGSETNVFYYKEKASSKPKNTRKQAKPIKSQEEASPKVSMEDAKGLQASMTLTKENASVAKRIMDTYNIEKISDFTIDAMTEYYMGIQGIGL